MGEKKEETSRPLLISLTDGNFKNEIFWKLHELSHTPYNALGFEHDITKMKGEKNTNMATEAKRMETMIHPHHPPNHHPK